MTRVSIGLPVRNGERFIATAIRSLLAQTFEDFEIVISDNASTDRTPDICREFAAIDPRIRYHRSDRDLGAGANFNRVFELSTGEYFRWAAHDDVSAPTYLERCVEVLDAAPEVVAAYPKASIIDENGELIERYDFDVDADHEDVASRVAGQIRGHQCYEVYGLIRRSALERTDLIGDFFAADAVLLIRLGLMGRLREVPECLFSVRRHAAQSEKMRKNPHEYAAWYRTGQGSRIVLPYWRVFGEYCRAIARTPMPLSQRLRCFALVGRWFVARAKLLARDLRRVPGQAIAVFSSQRAD
ncbi:MAG: glycosyltransferase family 2 protein [Myxococcota bacterium]